jgi:hypothetical protein
MQLFYDKAGTVSYTQTKILPALNYPNRSAAERTLIYHWDSWVAGSSIALIFQSDNKQSIRWNGNWRKYHDPTYSYLDGSVGMSLNSVMNNNPDNNYYLGAAYHHFNRPRNSFYRDKNIN